MKKKLHKLLEQDDPYEVIAVICPENHLKLSWLFNSNLGFEFKESESLSAEQKSDNQISFPTYRDEKLLLTLVKNRLEGKNLIKSLPNIDYLLKIDGFRPIAEMKKIIKNIKSVPGVLGAMQLEKEKTKELSVLKGV